MKKLRIGITFYLLVILCVVTRNFMLLFNYLVALILHELAHLFVASQKGYKLQKMHLNICGLYIKLDEQVNDRDSFLINIAGPSCNLFLSICCVALFWLVPNSYRYLNDFCLANLVLAVFNLIPIYPLDGGKIIKGVFKNKRHFNYFNSMLKYIIFSICIIMFICSLFHNVNYFFIIMALFVLTLKDVKEPTYSAFKFSKKRSIDKIIMLKIEPTETLFSLLKQLRNGHYTIFYCKECLPRYIDEDSVIILSTKYSLTTQIKDIKVLI